MLSPASSGSDATGVPSASKISSVPSGSPSSTGASMLSGSETACVRPFARLYSRSRAFSLVRTLCTVFCVPSVTGTAGSGDSGVTVTSEYAAKP